MSIRKKIRKVGKKVLYFYHCLKWLSFYKCIIRRPRKKNFVLNADWYKNARILLIAPHADDELLSSYTLLNLASKISVYYCGFTGSNDEKCNRIVRHNEVYMLCKELSVTFIDGKSSCDNLKESLKGVDIVIIPSIVDWHPEHRKVSYLLYETLKNSNLKPKIYSYSVTVPNESDQNVICNPMTKDEQKSKYDLFYKVYHSQHFMPIYRFRINERINGYSINEYAAETFLNHPLDKWMVETKVVMDAENRCDKRLLNLTKAVGNIGNMINVRTASREFYTAIKKEKLRNG